jgi:hypothetical protein
MAWIGDFSHMHCLREQNRCALWEVNVSPDTFISGDGAGFTGARYFVRCLGIDLACGHWCDVLDVFQIRASHQKMKIISASVVSKQKREVHTRETGANFPDQPNRFDLKDAYF